MKQRNAFIVCICFIILFIILTYNSSYKEGFQTASLKVHFHAFWPGFMEDKMQPWKYFAEILENVYGVPVILGSEDDSDILVESVFGDSILSNKKWKNTYLYSCEAYLRSNAAEYDIILSGQATGQPKNNIACPCYRLFMHTIPPLPEQPTQSSGIPVPKKDVICIISNPTGEVRNTFLNELDKHFRVDYGGKYKNNIGGPVKHAFGSQEFADFISEYKFVICMENNKQDAYITEKIFHGIRANTIPVYWGGTDVEKYINPNRFIHLKTTEDIPRIIGEMKQLAADKSAWQQMVAQPWEMPNQPDAKALAIQIRQMLGLQL